MKTPKRIQPLVNDGLVDEVLSQLMSGKEATVYVVRCGEEIRCAKVYKDVAKRSFKQAVEYTEGRKVRNSRRGRAMERADVRVPTPYGCFDGVLLMELVTDDEGNVAPRLSEVEFTEEQALEDHALMMTYVVRMLCAGVVHGDLSEFNVLVDDYGPVVIDLPQAVNAAANNHAKAMLERDVNNITGYYGQFAPQLLGRLYADELWELYEEGSLHPDTQLSGGFEASTEQADVDSVMLEIKAVMAEEEKRLERAREADEL
jgi:RIO kinase 1